jgi:CRISPR-associated protein Csh1
LGFIQAVHFLGYMASKKNENSPLADIINFLQLPYPLSSSGTGATYAIRVWLEAADPYSEVLEIKKVSCIDRIEYKAIGNTEIDIKERCLYREPVGSNVSWRFSPLYKLGKGSKEPKKELVSAGDWRNDKKCRYYKLQHNLLKDYEIVGSFTKDSTNKIMEDLEAQVDNIAEIWSDRKRSYFIIFGLKEKDRFLYPGQIPAFVNYFRKKLNLSSNKPSNKVNTYCALCGNKGKKLETLDKVFKFATFDKPGFLPGIKDGIGIREKVFPVCQDCYSIMCAGKEEMENRFVNFNAIPGILLYVIPEIITNREEFYPVITKFSEDFLAIGIRNETNLFNRLAKYGEGLVYHFLFAEINQAQLIIHSLIEDVPPTRLKQLEELWGKTCKVFNPDSELSNSDRQKLDSGLKQIVAVLMSLAGKSEQDKVVMKDKAITVISALLNGEPVKTNEFKALIVSRLPGLFADPDWLNPKERDKMPGRLKIKGMAEVVDFLNRANREVQ